MRITTLNIHYSIIIHYECGNFKLKVYIHSAIGLELPSR